MNTENEKQVPIGILELLFGHAPDDRSSWEMEEMFNCSCPDCREEIERRLAEAKEPANVRSVPGILRDGADTFQERNATYGDSYKSHGNILAAIFPDGLMVKTADDWNRIMIFNNIIGKMNRYSASFESGGHIDSAHDSMVYSAMLEELTRAAKGEG